MKKKLLIGVITLSMIFTSVSLCFATEGIDGNQIKAEHQADIVEKVTGIESINSNIEETRKSFLVQENGTDITIPKIGNGEVVMDSSSGESISMNLPKEVACSNGVATSSGTFVYSSNTEAVKVSVQAISQMQDGMFLTAVRSLVTIENSNAPKEYEFNFNLPYGYRLVNDYDFDDDYDKYDCGYIFILDEKNDIIGTIEPAWARDANGKDVATYYEIIGHKLIQHISFDEDTEFPVIADPTTGDTTTRTQYLTKSTVLKTRDSYAGKATSSFWGDLLSFLGGLVPYAGQAWSVAQFMDSRIDATSYSTWNTIYNSFPTSKNRLTITLKYRWHRKGAWVGTGIANYSYVKV